MVLLHIWRLGRQQHLYLSIPSLHVEELEAFPEMIADSVQPNVDRSQDWHFDLHCPSCRIEDRIREEHHTYSRGTVCLYHNELQGYGNGHTHDWCCSDLLDW